MKNLNPAETMEMIKQIMPIYMLTEPDVPQNTAEILFRTISFCRTTFNKFYKEDFERAISSYADEYSTVEEMKKRAIDEFLGSLTHIDFVGRNRMHLRNGYKLLARVNTTPTGKCTKQELIKQCEDRDYISFSTETEKNTARYKTRDSFMLVYGDIPPEAIVHMCPIDSDSDTKAKNEMILTGYPSFWYSPDEFDSLKNRIGYYDQITCKTKVNGTYVLPTAILSFKSIQPDAIAASKSLGVPIIVAYPQKGAIDYVGDIHENIYFNNPKKLSKMLDVIENHMSQRLSIADRKDLLPMFMQHFKLLSTPETQVKQVVRANLEEMLSGIENAYEYMTMSLLMGLEKTDIADVLQEILDNDFPQFGG